MSSYIPPRRSFLLAVSGFFAAVTLPAQASRDLIEPLFRDGVLGMFNWSQTSLRADLVRALQLYTLPAREEALVALEKSGLLALARKEDATCIGKALDTPVIRESVNADGLLVWNVRVPIRVSLVRGDKTVMTTVFVVNARVIVAGGPGSSSLKISSIWINDDKAVQ